jgi:hypothetical protein
MRASLSCLCAAGALPWWFGGLARCAREDDVRGLVVRILGDELAAEGPRENGGVKVRQLRPHICHGWRQLREKRKKLLGL